MPPIPAPERWEQVDHEFENSLQKRRRTQKVNKDSLAKPKYEH